MSLPDSFSIFSPTFSLFKSLTPQEYLQQSQMTLASIPKWKETALVVGVLSFVALFLSAAVIVVAEDDTKPDTQQGKAYNIAVGCALLSITISLFACISYPTIQFGVEPLILKRIDWLQAALNS